MERPKKRIILPLLSISLFGILFAMTNMTITYCRTVWNSESTYAPTLYSSGKKVLYISSYNLNTESVRSQQYGLNAELRGYGISCDSEYMDAKNYNSEEISAVFYETLKYKLSHHSAYDAVITGDDTALAFVSSHQQELFKETPVIFIGTTNIELAEWAAKKALVTGAIEDLHLDDVLRLAFRLCPNATKVTAIYGSCSPVDLGRQKQFFELQSLFPSYEFSAIDATKCTQANLASRISHISDKNIIVNLGFFEDADKNHYTSQSMQEFLTACTSLPTFSITPGGVGAGAVAGVIVNQEEAGKYAAELVRKITAGESPAFIPVYRGISTRYIFDTALMKRYGLSTANLPSHAMFVNGKAPATYKYRMLYLPILMLSLSFILLIILTIVYITGSNNAQKKLQQVITHNALTGLPNRRLAEQKIRDLIKKKHSFTLITIDINDLTSINDYYSREFGDKLLVEMSNRLQELETPSSYTVYRFTSDEFTLILQGRTLHPNDAEVYFLRQLLSAPFCTDQNPIFIKTSIGVTVYTPEIKIPEVYFSNADIAMHKAKEQGVNKTVFFTDAMRKEIEHKQSIVKDIEYACQNGGFSVMFQPQIDVQTGRIYGYEALARLKITRDGEERTIPPVDFIPAAEKSGYISKIGRIVTEKAIASMVEWRKNGMKLHKVSINYSVGQATDHGYVNYLSDLLEENAISPDLICIEITESLFLENRKQAMELFDQFRAIGVELALDDFGTGYSSLSYLAYLPVSTVKIDKSMIDSYLSREDKNPFLQNVVNLVHSLGLALTVEGIEQEWQYKKICQFGVDHIQGYYFSKPLLPDQVECYRPAPAEA
ncbi:MAG: EAL domain-containing protein [Treponema sp.]|nr:EAL domain-containing protein [Treponema sp.]